MAKYRLIFTAEVEIRVEADSEDEAKEKAETAVNYSAYRVDWVGSCVQVSLEAE